MKKAAPFYILMVLSMAAWGASWVSAKVIANMASPQIMVFWRYILTSVSLFPFILYRKDSFKVSQGAFKTIIAAAITIFIYSQLFFNGLKNGLAGAGGVLVTTISPLFTYLIVLLLHRHKLAKNEVLGLFLGIIGGVFLLQLWKFSSEQLTQGGNIYFLGAAFVWAILSILSPKAQRECSVFVYSFYLNGFAALLSACFIHPSEYIPLFKQPLFFWGNLLFLSLIGTTFATTAYFFSTQKLGSSKASSFVFLVPMFAVLFSFLFQGEVPQWETVLGGLLATSAVFIIHKKEKS